MGKIYITLVLLIFASSVVSHWLVDENENDDNKAFQESLLKYLQEDEDILENKEEMEEAKFDDNKDEKFDEENNFNNDVDSMNEFEKFSTINEVSQERKNEEMDNKGKEVMNVYEDKNSPDLYYTDRRKRGFFTIASLVTGTISGAFEVYKYERGCKDVSGFTDAIEAIPKIQQELSRLQKEINLAWAPVVSIGNYFSRMIAYLVTLDEQISKFESLQQEIVTVIDPDIERKLTEATKEIEADIAARNATYIVDLDSLLAKYYTKFEYGKKLVGKFKGIAILAGTKIVKGVMWLYNRKRGSYIVSGNPSFFSKVKTWVGDQKKKVLAWKDAKVEKFLNFISKKFTNFISKHKTIGRRWNKAVGSEKSKAQIKKIKKRLKLAAKSLLLGASIGYDFYLGVKFFKECFERRDNAQMIVQNLTAEADIMKGIKNDVDKLYVSLSQNYTELKQQLVSEPFLNFVNNTEAFYRQYSDNSDVDTSYAVQKMKSFKDNIKNDDAGNSDQLTLELIGALTKTNNILNCLYVKVKVMKLAIHSCMTGKATIQEIYRKAISQPDVISCAGIQIDEQEFIKEVTEEVKENGGQTVCTRNNVNKQVSVCNAWYQDTEVSKVVEMVQLPIEDVWYIIGICPPAKVTIYIQESICLKKVQFSLQDTLNKFYKYERSEIIRTYNECQLTGTSIENICRKKKDGYKVEFVENFYRFYPRSAVTNVYNQCKLEVSQSEKNMICIIKSAVGVFNDKFFGHLISRYNRQTVLDIYNQC